MDTNDPELTPTCDPPRRTANPDEPIGHVWWLEPSHPEVDPKTGLPPAAHPPEAGPLRTPDGDAARERERSVGSTAPTRK